MIVAQDDFDKNSFLESFKKRFVSFCDKSPLFLRFKFLDNGVLIYDYSKEADVEPKFFEFDYSLDDKNNIKKIKDFLVENWYPVITISKNNYRRLSAIEIQEKMSKEGLTFDEASELTINDKQFFTFRVEKVINMDNNIVVRDMKTKYLYLYKAQIPVSTIIGEIFTDINLAQFHFAKKCDKVCMLEG